MRCALPVRVAAWTGLSLLAACGDWSLFKRSEEATDPVVVEESFQQAPLPAVDVLWVIDNSCSMSEEQSALTSAFTAFVEGLDAYDLAWQTGVIATESSGDLVGILRGNPWIVHPDLDDPVAAFADAAALGTTATGSEAGLDAAWLALNAPLIDEANIGFRRDDAALHIVIVSDGEDQSGAVLGEDPVGAMVDFLATEAERTGRTAALSAIIGLPPDGCDTAIASERYAEAATLSGGETGSICEADLSVVIEAISQASMDWQTRFPLQAPPAAGTVAVWIDELRQDDEAFTLEEDPATLVFLDAPPAGSTIRVRYELADEEDDP